MTADFRFTRDIDNYMRDMRSEGRINSDATERSYRSILMQLATEISNRPVRTVGRDDIKRTLRRWPNPNSQRVARAIFVSFFDWAMEEGIRKDNPARQTRRPKRQPTSVYRLTRAEAASMLHAANGPRERRAIHLGFLAGLRNAELRGLKGEHFQRPSYIWVSEDIAKGSRERWIPILPELEPIIMEIQEHVSLDEYVLPAQRWRDAPWNREQMDLKQRPSSGQALRSLVMRVAKRAGIAAHIHPHLMRHAFGDHIAKYAGIRNAQFLLGHADVGTTQIYTDKPTLDDLAEAIDGFRFLPPAETPGIADHATKRLEPVITPVRSTARDDENWVAGLLEGQRDKLALYTAAFDA